MNSKLVDLFGGMIDYIGRSKKLSRMARKLPLEFKTYDYKVTVTFNQMTPEQNVNHAEYGKIFGEVRENFGLAALPKFREEIGKRYLLKTRNAYYELISDFHFGDTMVVKMFVSELNTASFNLAALYTSETGEIKAFGTQKIVCTDLNGKPIKMPDEIHRALNTVCCPIPRQIRKPTKAGESA